MDRDIQMYFDMIAGSVDRIVNSMDGLSGDALNWEPVEGESSSLYVLATHTMGNVEQAILATIAGHPDYRNRDAEFESRGDSPEEIQRKWSDLRSKIQAALGAVSPDDLNRNYEHPRRGPMNGWGILLNTATHAGEHAGHAELTRQLIDSSGIGE